MVPKIHEGERETDDCSLASRQFLTDLCPIRCGVGICEQHALAMARSI